MSVIFKKSKPLNLAEYSQFSIPNTKQVLEIILSIVLIVLFAGSIFLTSGNLVNANSGKNYFVIIYVWVLLIIGAFSVKRFQFSKVKCLLAGIFIVTILQAILGWCQLFHLIPSHHSKFIITGSFDNLAGFAAVLSLSFPVILHLFLKAKRTVI